MEVAIACFVQSRVEVVEYIDKSVIKRYKDIKVLTTQLDVLIIVPRF